jgi:ferredoxin
MRVKVDQDACVGSEDCVNACPEIFKMEGEKAVAYVTDVPKNVEEKCKTAADSCPAAAITFE